MGTVTHAGTAGESQTTASIFLPAIMENADPSNSTPTPTPTVTPTPTATAMPTATATPTMTPTATPCAAVKGIISQDSTWVSGCTYLVTGNILVEENVHLNIQPDVTVKFDGDFYIKVLGQFEAVGAPNQPIRFTSNKPVPAPGDWSAIRLAYPEGVTQRIGYTRFSNMVEVAVIQAISDLGFTSDKNSYMIIHNNILQYNGGGVLIWGNIDFRRNSVTHNQGYGV